MSIFKRRAAAVQDRSEADARPFADRCRQLRTRQGRTAHLEHPERPGQVLCGWTTPLWHPAEPGLQVCALCKVAAEIEDERKP